MQACNGQPAPASRAQQLHALEQLLWRGSTDRPKRLSSNLLPLLLRGVMTFVLRRIVLDVQDSAVQYTQCGEPGPLAVGRPARLMDAVRVSVRAMTLTPGSRQAAAAGAWCTVRRCRFIESMAAERSTAAASDCWLVHAPASLSHSRRLKQPLVGPVNMSSAAHGLSVH